MSETMLGCAIAVLLVAFFLMHAKNRRLQKIAKEKAERAYRKTSHGKAQGARQAKDLGPLDFALAGGLAVMYLAHRDTKKPRRKREPKSKPVLTKTCEYCGSQAFSHQTHCESCGAPLPKG